MVGIAVDGASAYGRGIMRGAMQYINAQRRWEIYAVTRHTFDTVLSWTKCDGAIIAGIGPEAALQIESSCPAVVSCSGSSDPDKFIVVCLDDQAAGAMAAEHLLNCQIENFAFFGSSTSPHSRNRQKGFVEKVAGLGHVVVPCEIPYSPGNRRHESYWPQFIEWLRGLPKPIGIMAVDDDAALDVASACRHAGIAVPEQVAIIGVNNDDLICESAWPPLSSVDAGFPRIGYAAAQILERLLNGEKVVDRMTRLLPLGVVQRVSTNIMAVGDPIVADALRYIREHACNPCSVGDVLRHVPTGRRWLERQFEKTLGRSPGDEILRVQLESAKRLLIQPGLSLPDVANRSGFSTAPALGRAFLRATGTTPAAYRRATLRGGN